MALFTLGNFVSKVLVMLLVPLYTNVLTTAEYGRADVMQTTLLLLVPLLTMNAGEAALRFGLERTSERGSILRTMLRTIAAADIVVVALCGAGYFFLRLALKTLPFGAAYSQSGLMSPHLYFLFFELLFITNSLYEGMILCCQGFERIKTMVAGSILCTMVMIGSNIFFLLVIKIGLPGYFLSQVLAFGAGALVMLIGVRDEWRASRKAASDDSQPPLAVQMGRYGRSMMVYSTSSWANNAIDRYFVLGMCGAAANGLYGVAYKIPAILTVFQRIFAQAWQISANKTYEDEDAAAFFSHVYEGYQSIMTVGCSFLILLVKPIASLLFAKEFYYAWPLVPPLLISVIFGALTGFLGSVCLAFKDGQSMGRATGAGALVNIILNFILIRLIGPMGAALATMISYFVMFALALRAATGHVDFPIKRKRDMLAYLLLIIQMSFVSRDRETALPVSALCFVALLILYIKRLNGVLRERFCKK